jgi:hypothetical protein
VLFLRSCSACAAKSASASVVDVDASIVVDVVDVDVVVVDIVVDVDAVVADDVVVVVVVADVDVVISDCCRGFLCLRFFFDSSCEVKAAPASVCFRFLLSRRGCCCSTGLSSEKSVERKVGTFRIRTHTQQRSRNVLASLSSSGSS